ncbi:hypothetical protein Cylst_5199 [Cylindrospermum stagnale PCC 7417]|uniref:Uncharacterized protein n=1 Tax=Cylindrospermum stagnale PCC 7417 TaxID=56107 RepID=K9X3L0_9NOST|nr:hypothetical protein Cylst_5199 [Cylindrospermum stagnale PCC 7417]
MAAIAPITSPAINKAAPISGSSILDSFKNITFTPILRKFAATFAAASIAIESVLVIPVT